MKHVGEGVRGLGQPLLVSMAEEGALSLPCGGL